MTSDHQKPSRDDLLTELESIRESLLPEELQQASITEENSQSQNPPSSETIETASMEADIEIASGEPEPAAAESPERKNENPLENNDKERPMHVLPGQQSLFDEEKKNAAAEAARANDAAQAPAHEPEVKENPFLPRHIKQKLEKERSHYQNQVDDFNASSHTHSTFSQEVVSIENEALIDELVAEYLPKIEEVLKQRLREKIQRESAAAQ